MEAASQPSGAPPEDDKTTTDRKYTTISIPQPLYHEIKRAIEGTGFRSPTEYLVYVTRLSLQTNGHGTEPGAAVMSRPRSPFPR